MTTFNAPPPTSDVPGMQSKLTARLARLGSRIRAQIAFDALVRGLAVVFALLTLSLVLDFWLELNVTLRVLYWLVTLAAGAHYLYYYGIKPLSKKLGPIELAEAVDVAQKHTGQAQLAPRVATVLQLPGMLDDGEALSGQMVHDAVGRSYHSLEQTDFTAAANSKHMMQCCGILLGALLLPGIVGTAMQYAGTNVLNTWSQRWLMFADTSYPRNTSIEILGMDKDGYLVVPAGENFTLRSVIKNKDDTDVEEVRISIEPEKGDETTVGMESFSKTDYRLDMSPLTEPATATVRAGDQTLEFKIKPAARPRLAGLKVNYTHPTDEPGSKPKTIDFNGAEGEVSLLEHNQIELILTANVKIQTPRYVLDKNRGDDEPALPTFKRVAPNAFAMNWTHRDDMRFRIELVSTQASLVSQPIPVSVGLKEDRKPSVRVRSTGVGPRITPNAMIPLSELKASDDLGLRDVKLTISRERTGERIEGVEDTPYDPIIELYSDDQATQKEFLDKYDLEVDQFGVRPMDLIRITGVATDNRYSDDPAEGGQVGESTTLTYRIVTHQELFREIIARQQQARAAFRKAIEDCRDIKVELQQAKTGVEVTAQERRFRAARREVWKVSNELAKSAEEMRLNRLGGTKEDGNKAYESMRTNILDPMKSLHSQTMDEQLNALASAVNADAPRIKAITDNQQAVIDEMKWLLLKMDRWDELLDTINQLTRVIELQEQTKKKIDELLNEQVEDIFD